LERASGCLWSPAIRGFARDEVGVDGQEVGRVFNDPTFR
jgi:hypothetical protein